MTKFRVVSVLLLTVAVIFLNACKKADDKPNGGTGNTDLQVYVFDANEQPVEAAIVNIYGSASDRDAEVNAINTSVTGSKGFAYFSDVVAATYYAKATKNYGSSGGVKTGVSDTGVPIKPQDQTALTIVLE